MLHFAPACSQVCEKFALHPYNEAVAAEHTAECTSRHARLAARTRSARIECAVCLEPVLGKASPADRKFGLMACDHAFCLACIRSWRATTGVDVDSVSARYNIFTQHNYFAAHLTIRDLINSLLT